MGSPSPACFLVFAYLTASGLLLIKFPLCLITCRHRRTLNCLHTSSSPGTCHFPCYSTWLMPVGTFVFIALPPAILCCWPSKLCRLMVFFFFFFAFAGCHSPTQLVFFHRCVCLLCLWQFPLPFRQVFPWHRQSSHLMFTHRRSLSSWFSPGCSWNPNASRPFKVRIDLYEVVEVSSR